MGRMPYVLNVWMYECYSEVDSTIVEQVGNVIPRIFNWQVVGIKVKYKKFMADKSTDVYSAADPMDGHYFDWNRSPIQQQSEDVEGYGEDNATTSLDALVESVVNHNSDNTNVGTSTTMHVHDDHMDVEGVSADIGPATLVCLVAVVKNQKPNNDNVGTSNMQVNYSSTLSESAQFKLDALLKVIAAPIDDVPIEVVPPAEPVVNQYDISDSQLPLDFPDAVGMAHQAAKTLLRLLSESKRDPKFSSLHTQQNMLMALKQLRIRSKNRNNNSLLMVF
ncbi:hypothetical protein FXO38_08945 [Capsicum annuum]|uniref:Uncharacterized protein n=1 Tax=Capsicum annuum TaxID=4072 RepID=A0A2G2XZN0_CAPAN|nr:hypothetical protein FXO37_21301 [Capsicum annuum]KAF3666731.1 hypothetical protein FXO38_08945 [Capsicum annuum]PHT62940.1 hypothetical protein T459_33227 [Capsicum annuum]